MSVLWRAGLGLGKHVSAELTMPSQPRSTRAVKERPGSLWEVPAILGSMRAPSAPVARSRTVIVGSVAGLPARIGPGMVTEMMLPAIVEVGVPVPTLDQPAMLCETIVALAGTWTRQTMLVSWVTVPPEPAASRVNTSGATVMLYSVPGFTAWGAVTS